MGFSRFLIFAASCLLILFSEDAARAEALAGTDPATEAAHEAKRAKAPETLLGEAPPYAPRTSNYFVEFGWMRAKDDLLWVGAGFGLNVGTCFFVHSETCQQYVDIIGGASVREGESDGLFLGSLRWQYVNFPARSSPFWRVFAGGVSVSRPEERRWRTVEGVGVGVTTYLHERVDLRLEARVGYIDSVYGQALVGIEIKTDHLLREFALRLRDLGYGTVETAIQATGTTLKATGEGIEGLAEGVTAPFRSKSPEPVLSPEASPNVVSPKSTPSPRK